MNPQVKSRESHLRRPQGRQVGYRHEVDCQQCHHGHHADRHGHRTAVPRVKLLRRQVESRVDVNAAARVTPTPGAITEVFRPKGSSQVGQISASLDGCSGDASLDNSPTARGKSSPAVPQTGQTV